MLHSSSVAGRRAGRREPCRCRGAGGGRRRARGARRGRQLDGGRQGRLRDRDRACQSRRWFTLDDGELTEVYAPDLGTPSIRDLQFVVTDGRTFAEREREDATHAIELADPRSLTYRQVNTARSGRWRITKTYVTDPARAAVLVDVRFESLTGRPYELYALARPGALEHRRRRPRPPQGATLVALRRPLRERAGGEPARRARSRAATWARATAGPTCATDFRIDWTLRRGAARRQRRPDRAAAADRRRRQAPRDARARLRRRPGRRRRRPRRGAAAAASRPPPPLRRGLARLPRRPRAPAPASPGRERLYDVSLMVMAAIEDKTYRGAVIASPSMAWVWGDDPRLLGPVPPRLVARPLPGRHRRSSRPATAPRASARSTTCGSASSSPTAASRRTPTSTARRTGRTCSSTRSPTRSCSRGSSAASTRGTWSHVSAPRGCILAHGPASQERWENAEGYSPATIAAEIAGLVCAAEIAERNGDAADAARYRDGRRRAGSAASTAGRSRATARSPTTRTTCG